MHAARCYVGCVHIADKHLKCLLVSHMRDGKSTSTVCGKHNICFEIYLVIWDLFVWLCSETVVTATCLAKRKNIPFIF